MTLPPVALTTETLKEPGFSVRGSLHMSSVFFIAPYDPKDWEQQDVGEVPKIFTVDIQTFDTELKKRWPKAEIWGPLLILPC